MTRHHHNDGTTDLIIDRADPQVWISDQLLRALHDEQEDNPWAYLRVDATLKRDPRCDAVNCCLQEDHGTCFMGAVLTIKAQNRTVIYKIHQWVEAPSDTWAAHSMWAASWPD